MLKGRFELYFVQGRYEAYIQPEGLQYNANMYGREGHLIITGLFYSIAVMASTVDLQSYEREIGSTFETKKDVILFRGILAEHHQNQMRDPTRCRTEGSHAIELLQGFDQDDKLALPVSDFMIGMIHHLFDVRPDICFSVVKIAQRQATPRQKDVDALNYLIHFLYATRSSGVTLRRSDKCQADLLLTLRAFTDCSYACHGNGKSHYGFCFDLVDSNTVGTLGPEGSQYDPNLYGEEGPLLDTGMFYSKSVMASTVDLQSCEGGIGGTLETTKDVILFRGILAELHQDQLRATPIFGDNDSTIRLGSSYNGNHKRVRYMLPKINWLMEQTKVGVVQLYRMGTRKLPPDVLTKIGSGSE